jgi:hypothetical protein
MTNAIDEEELGADADGHPGAASQPRRAVVRASSERREGHAAWTIERVKERLKEAADTLRRLKIAGPLKPARPRTSWPDVVRNYFEAGLDPEGRPQETRVLPACPSPRAIDEMDEALGWLAGLTREQRIAVFAGAMGIGRSRIARRLACSRVTVWRYETAGLLRIAAKLNA